MKSWSFFTSIYLLLGSFILAGPLPEPDDYWIYKVIKGDNGTIDKELKLSVFLPDNYNEDQLFPTIVIYHGGSWRAGTPSMHYPDAKYWSSRGMIAISVDYRLKDRDNVEVPLVCIQDAKSAIRYLRRNAKKLKVDSNKIVSAGGSAGGQLAAAVSLVKASQTNAVDEDLAISSVPQAIILYNPWFKCAKEYSPSKQVTTNLPPIITFSGGLDPGIPVDEMVAWHKSLKDKENYSALYIGNNGKHGFCNGRNPGNPFFYWSTKLADDFLVSQGILNGKATIEAQMPKGVKILTEEDYTVYK